MMYIADELPSSIMIGFTGEKNFREIEFDMRQWLSDMPGGKPAVVYIRPGETEPYKPKVTGTEGIMTWVITEEDLGNRSDNGRIQLEIASETQKRKGKIITVQVHPGIMR